MSRLEELKAYEKDFLELRGLHVGQVVGAQRWGLDASHPGVWMPPHAGVLLSVLDPRAWNNTIAVNGRACEAQVLRHVDDMRRDGLDPWAWLPVIWSIPEPDGRTTKSLMSQTPDQLYPYELDVESWSKTRIKAGQAEDRRLGKSTSDWRTFDFSAVEAWRAAGEAVTFVSVMPDAALSFHLKTVEGGRVLTVYGMEPEAVAPTSGLPSLGEVVFSAEIEATVEGKFDSSVAFAQLKGAAQRTIADHEDLLRPLSLWSSQTYPGFRVMPKRDVATSWDVMRMRA
jgi:hypothetical protein